MNLWFDLKYAWRLLRKSWGYALMCASVVALSVGLAVWTNALTYSQLFKPLEFPGAERWYNVQIAANPTDRPRAGVDAFTYQRLLEHNRTADHLGAFTSRSVVLSEGEATTSLRAAAISPRLFASMRVPPILGRKLEEKDAQPGAPTVAVISYDTWQTYFAGDRSIVGRTARMDAAPVQIVGVMPREFLVFRDFEVWVPLHLPKLARPQDSKLVLTPFLALREGQSVESIVGEMKPAVDDVNGSYPKLFHRARRAALIPAHRTYTHGVKPIVTMMSLMGLAVLLLGCVNISMVFLARLLERSRELALRGALGASRARLMRQSLLETALVVVAGLAGGYGLVVYGIDWTQGIGRFIDRVMVDGRSTNMPELRPFDLLVAVLAAVVVWLLSTLIPAWRVAGQDAAVVLAASGKGATLRGSNKSVGLLVGLQVVISCVVLVVSGNMVMAVDQEVSKPSGLSTANVLFTTDATPFDARYGEPSQRLRYWDELTASVASKVPGAQIAFASMPPTRPLRVAATIETRQGSDHEGALMLPSTVVSESYFDLTGIRLRSGRLFERTDDGASLKVAIVDEQMAGRYWPEQNPLGKRVQLSPSDEWLTIVGVVSAVGGAPYRADSDIGAIYQPLRQAAPSEFHVLLRVPNAAADVRPALRAAAFAVDRDLPLQNPQKLDDYLAAVKLGTSAMIPVFLTISLITAILAASGLFGLISRSVAQRTQDVGIRRALGATAWRATSMFLRQGTIYLIVAVAGLGMGIMIVPALSRAIPNILHNVVPVTVGVVLLMTAVISTASYLPTRRAVALEPGDALRYE